MLTHVFPFPVVGVYPVKYMYSAQRRLLMAASLHYVHRAGLILKYCPSLSWISKVYFDTDCLCKTEKAEEVKTDLKLIFWTLAPHCSPTIVF